MLDLPTSGTSAELLPDYLRDVYSWAYLTPWSAELLDRTLVVQAILWGNAQRLIDKVLVELSPGQTVLQPAAVYGDFSRQVAGRVGSGGRLVVRDIAPLQVARTTRKVGDLPQASVAQSDAAEIGAERFDVVTCFFLLHEVPDTVKVEIVAAMLGQLKSHGKVVFVDYHEPAGWHPLKPLMRLVFKYLEPFATGLWRREIAALAGERATLFRWRKSTMFGGLYQIVIAEKL